jgi:hypothetical protein
VLRWSFLGTIQAVCGCTWFLERSVRSEDETWHAVQPDSITDAARSLRRIRDISPMTQPYRVASNCPNLNHRRSDAPVSHCPQCGEVVNAHVRSSPCTDAWHDSARRNHSMFCVHCGLRLMTMR